MGRSGDNFEKFIEDSWPVPNDIQGTRNSGAVHEDGDFASGEFQIEAKEGYAEGVTVRREWINKLVRAAKLRGKMPLWFHKTLEGDAFAILTFEDFLGLYEELHDMREE